MATFLCKTCGNRHPLLSSVSIEKRFDCSGESPATIADLSILVKRLVNQVRQINPESPVAASAMDYLKMKGISGSKLREID